MKDILKKPNSIKVTYLAKDVVHIAKSAVWGATITQPPDKCVAPFTETMAFVT